MIRQRKQPNHIKKDESESDEEESIKPKKKK